MFCMRTRRGQLDRDGALTTVQICWRGHVLGLAAPGVSELRIALRLEARLSPSRFPTAAAFATRPIPCSNRSRQVVPSVPHFLFFSFPLFLFSSFSLFLFSVVRSGRLGSRGVGAVAPSPSVRPACA
jgi:hypothetical protein